MPTRLPSAPALLIAGVVIATTLACWQPPQAAASLTAAPASAPPAPAPAQGPITSSSPASSPQKLCEQVTPAALTAITSAAYSETTSQIDTATMKHCEYRGGPNTVSLMLVLGSGAHARFETSTKFPGIQPVSGLGDRANWERVRGTLSVLAGERSVEVTVSSSHGTDPTRQQFARQIAQLVNR